MKVIFLDVDGVLNCHYTKERIGGIIGIEDAKVKLLKQLVDETDAKIVLSSSWRMCKDSKTLNKDWKYLLEKLAAQGLELLDTTPTGCEHSYRGFEIQTWFQNWEGEEIESFIILDDDQDMKPYGSRLIQTSWYEGLKPKHITKAIKLLGDECKPWFDDKPYWQGQYNFGENRQI